MLFPVNNPSEQFFCLNKQQRKCYVYSRHSSKVKGGFKGVGRGGHDHSFFFENYFASFFIDK